MVKLVQENIIIISIIYDELEQNSYYERVEVNLEGITVQFHSGDIVNDFKEANRFSQMCHKCEKILGKVLKVMLSSSVDHFVQDNDGYGWKEDSSLGELIIKI